MIEILEAIKKTLMQSTAAEFRTFCEQNPSGGAWYLISDYCLDDPSKQNDVFAFSVLLPHDTLENIKAHISACAPKDIKRTRTIDDDFMRYLNCPVFYHFSFLVDKRSSYLRDWLTVSRIREMLEELLGLTCLWQASSPEASQYFSAVRTRIQLFLRDTQRKRFNQRLARQLWLTSLFASVIAFLLAEWSSAAKIAWVSDRDAIVPRYDSFVFDSAYLWLMLQLLETRVPPGATEITYVNEPKLYCVNSEDSFELNYDELVRVPDYLAGTMADFKVADCEFSADKYLSVLWKHLVNATNHAVIHVSLKDKTLTTRRIRFTKGEALSPTYTPDDQQDDQAHRTDFSSHLDQLPTLPDLIENGGSISILVSRQEVERRQVRPFRRHLESLSESRGTILEAMNKVDFHIAGYDNDLRELFEIPEVRKWIEEAVKKIEHLCYFLRLEDAGQGISLIINCMGDAEVIGDAPGGKLVRLNTPERLLDFLHQQFVGLNAFVKAHDLGEGVNREVFERLDGMIQSVLAGPPEA